MEKPRIDQYPPTDERTYINLKDGSINWKKYAMALDDYIMERWEYKYKQQINCNLLHVSKSEVVVCSNVKHKTAHSKTGFCSICKCVAYIPEQTERRASLIAFIQEKVKNRDMNLFMNASELVDQMLKRNL